MTDENIQRTITSYWDGRAGSYDADQQREERLDADHAAWSRAIRQALAPLTDPEHSADTRQVLDLGTGSGYLAFILADLGYEVTATDLSQGMLKIATDRAAHRKGASQALPQFGVGDAIEPDFPPASFDAITNRYLMWTLHDPVKAVQNWARLLREGGRLVIIDAPWFPHGIAANTTQGFAQHYAGTVASHLPLAESHDIEDTVAVIRQAGFHNVQATPLTEIFTLDQTTGVSEGHHVQLQHIITATKSSTVDPGTDHALIAAAAVENMSGQIDDWAALMGILSDPTRLKILIAAHAAPWASVSELAHAVDATPNAVTQALRKLQEAGIVTSRAQGRFRRWMLTDDRLHALLHHVAAPHSPLHPHHPA